jgi:hypothetical protein
MSAFILMSAERALESVVTSLNIDGLHIYRGIHRAPELVESNEPPSKKLPCVTCEAKSATWNVHHENNWHVSAVVEVEQHAHDSFDAAYEELVSTVFEALHDTTLATKLSAAVVDFTCHHALPEAMDVQIGSGVWTARMTLTLDCTPADRDE